MDPTNEFSKRDKSRVIDLITYSIPFFLTNFSSVDKIHRPLGPCQVCHPITNDIILIKMKFDPPSPLPFNPRYRICPKMMFLPVYHPQYSCLSPLNLTVPS